MNREDQLAAAAAARDAGMAAALNAADPRVVVAIDGVIEDAIASGRRFSANSIRDQFPTVRSGLVGTRVKSYATRREDGHPLMVCVGREPSSLQSTKTSEIKVWLGWQAYQELRLTAS